MKIFNKILPTVLALLILASCKDSDQYTTGEWGANADYADLFFPETSGTLELDPSDPTTASIVVERRNTEGQITVNFDIEENQDDVFTISPATFADGESTATITVNFPTAKIGTSYLLRIAANDPAYVSEYSQNRAYSLNITRVKWNDSGWTYTDANGNAQTIDDWYCYYNGNKVVGYCTFYDDVISSIFGSQYASSYIVPVQMRDDRPGVYRIVDPFYYGRFGSAAEEGHPIIINAEDPNRVYLEPSEQDLGIDLGYGTISLLSLAGYYVEYAEEHPDEADEVKSEIDKYCGKLENGVITFPKNAFYVNMADYNGGDWYDWESNITLVLNPDLNPYRASISEDFEWESIGSGEYTSGKLGSSKEVQLYIGTCVTTTDECDKVFADTYGTAYKIESPYSNGHDFIFCVNNEGAITYPDEYLLQPTGLEAFGEDVYARINPNESSFSENAVTLNITFMSEDGSTEYGTYDDAWVKGSWESLGIGLLSDDAVAPLYQAEIPTFEVEILENTDTPGLYRVKNAYTSDYPYNEPGDYDDTRNYFLEVDATNPEAVSIAKQALGVDWGYGMMYIESISDGTLADGIISFPTKGMAIYDDDGAYYANQNGEFQIVLPEAYENMDAVKAYKPAKQHQSHIRTAPKKTIRESSKWVGRKVTFTPKKGTTKSSIVLK